VSLDPIHTCTTPNLNNITRMEFHTRDNATVNGNSGLWDDGDQLTLWFDNLRLVDQDSGSIRWTADGTTTSYYIYFDMLDHEGHPPPQLADLGAGSVTGTEGTTEAGGYLHLVTGASTGGLGVWTAPVVEKVRQTAAAPVATAPLRVHAARDEFEPFQLVVRSDSQQSLAVSISDFSSGANTIASTAVTLHRLDYVNVTQLSDHFGRLGMWPDPLYPVAMGGSVTFPAGLNQPLWFTVHVPRDAKSGIYQATASVGSATIPVELEVWGFALPQEIHLAGEWGFRWSNVVEQYKGTILGTVQPCYWDLLDALYEDFADHRLTPKGVGWPAGLNFPGGVEYDCAGGLDPYSWGMWGFHSLAGKYLDGNQLDNGSGFPSFLIRGPSSNSPPDSRPSNFCGQSRGTDPPGITAYNDLWFEYWEAVSDYVGATSDYAAKGTYHIVNEPQTFDDYDIAAYLSQETRTAAPNVRILLSEQVEPAIHSNATYTGAGIDVWVPTISNYQVERAHDRQLNHGEDVWWYFLYGDRPPLPNPTVMDRTGVEARILPWLAWLERVDGLLYYSTTDWSPDPWTDPWTNDSNGDGFLFYPPVDSTIAFNACVAQSNRLVPSIRWELLREGMEDYEYLWLVNNGPPEIGVANAADSAASQFIDSRTRFSRVPTDLMAARTALADFLSPIFADGFESGDTSAWSIVLPPPNLPVIDQTQDPPSAVQSGGSPSPTNTGTQPSSGLQKAAGTCVVWSTTDSGAGSLRQCMIEAVSGDTITFDPALFLPGTPVSIDLSSSLPALISDDLTIDATGAGVILDGSLLSSGNGLDIESDNNTIRGLQILHFPDSGIEIGSRANNVIGGDRTMGQGNIFDDNGIGVAISGVGATGNIVTGNSIGNCTTGVQVDSQMPLGGANEIVGNLVGFDIAGSPSGNVTGIAVGGNGQNHVIERNHISWNTTGISTTGSATLASSSFQNCLSENTTGLRHGGAAIGLRLRYNWWGSADGPSGIGPGSGDSIELSSTGTADYDPWLTHEGAGCGGIGVFADGFESGNTSAWSHEVP
jgi:hypothetical protein